MSEQSKNELPIECREILNKHTAKITEKSLAELCGETTNTEVSWCSDIGLEVERCQNHVITHIMRFCELKRKLEIESNNFNTLDTKSKEILIDLSVQLDELASNNEFHSEYEACIITHTSSKFFGFLKSRSEHKYEIRFLGYDVKYSTLKNYFKGLRLDSGITNLFTKYYISPLAKY